MMDVIQKNISKLSTDNNIETIRSYFIAGGIGIELNELQEDLKNKIVFADETVRSKTGLLSRENIANIIAERLSVSRATAYNYMRYAEEIFSTSNPLNKKYLIQLRIDWCMQMANKCVLQKDLENAGKFEALAQKYISIYPDINKEQAKRTQVFVLPVAVKNETLTEDAAFEIINNSLLNGTEDGNKIEP